MTISSYLRRLRRGLTLIELLVVAFILVLFVAVAAPLLKPATADRKVREAARQLNAYIAEAKAFAAQRGRPVGLAFDRVAATGEAARSSNIITRLYLAQSPPHYSGDMTTAEVRGTYLGDPVSNPGNFGSVQMPPWYVANVMPPTINSNHAKWYELTFDAQSAMLNVIIDSYIPESVSDGYVPFRIRLGTRGNAGANGPFYDGYARYVSGSPKTFKYYFWAPFGTKRFTQPQPNELKPPALTNYEVPYEIEFFPQLSTDSPLEFPTGTVVDLQYSGFGQSGNQFFDNTGISTSPVILVFSPSGDVEQVVNGGNMTNQLSRIHFLVGTLKTAADSMDFANPGTLNTNSSNLADPACQWVSLNTRTGHVTTADNLTPTDFSSVNAAIQQARGFATGLNTKGGR